MTITPLVSEFKAIGELKNLEAKSNGRVKYLLLSANNEEYWIKVAKDQPANLAKQLQPGCKIKVSGMVKHQIHEDQVEYKALAIKLLETATLEPFQKSKKSKAQAKVLICQKSNCWNKGGKASCETLKQELEKQGISDQVDIKMTGCLKKCKKAPNVIVLPDKKHYVNVKPKQVSAIVQKHFV